MLKYSAISQYNMLKQIKDITTDHCYSFCPFALFVVTRDTYGYANALAKQYHLQPVVASWIGAI